MRYALLFIAFMALPLIGQAHEKQSTAKQPRELRVLLGDPPSSYDPVFSSLSSDGVVHVNLYESLVATDTQGEIIPGASETGNLEAGGSRYRFKLRNNLRWSDGHPVTARDYQTTLQRMANPAIKAKDLTKALYLVKWVKHAQAISEGKLPPEALGVKVIGSNELVIEMAQPIGFFNHVIANALHPTPTHVLAQQGENWSRPEHHVSNGPYRLAAVNEGKITLEANPFFHGRQSLHFKTVQLFLGDQRRQQQLTATINPDIAMDYNHSAQTHWLVKYKNFHVHRHDAGQAGLLLFNTRDPVFSDVRVRQALQLAAELDRLIPRIANGDNNLIPTYSLWQPPNHQGNNSPNRLDAASAYRPHWHSWPSQMRLTAAKNLLAAAGYDKSRPLVLSLHSIYDPPQDPIINALSHQWERLGVKVNSIEKPYPQHYQDIFKGKYQLAIASWRPKFNDPVAMLRLLESSSPNNLPGWQSPRYDQLLKSIYPMTQSPDRQQILLEAHRIIWQQVPLMALYYRFEANTLIADDLLVNKDDNYTQFRYLRRSEATAR